MADEQIMRLLDFTAEDLSANRQMQFSPRQLEAINTSNMGCRAILGLVVLIGLAAGAYALLAPIDDNERFAIGINALLWGGVAFVLLRVIFSKRVAPPPQVQRASGKIRLQVDTNRGTKYHILLISKQDFRIPLDLYQLLQEDSEHVVYYTQTPLGIKLLSME